MFFFIKNLIIYMLILELTPMFNFFDDLDFNLDNLFIFFFLFLFLINTALYEHSEKNDKKFDIDIVLKYFYLFFKIPSYFFNFSKIIFKKIYLYLLKFKYRFLISTTKIVYRKYFSNFFIVWKPLFKKISYFGYYRSNRSKWIK